MILPRTVQPQRFVFRSFPNIIQFIIAGQLLEFINLFYANLDATLSKFHVYNVLTMSDEFMVVSGMPQNIGRASPRLPGLDWYCRCRRPTRGGDRQPRPGPPRHLGGLPDPAQTQC